MTRKWLNLVLLEQNQSTSPDLAHELYLQSNPDPDLQLFSFKGITDGSICVVFGFYIMYLVIVF